MQLDVSAFIDDLGGTFAVATLLNIKAPSVSGWKGKGRIPDDKLIRLASVSEARGFRTRKELFPNDYAAIWPELRLAAASDPRASCVVDPPLELVDRRVEQRPFAHGERRQRPAQGED